MQRRCPIDLYPLTPPDRIRLVECRMNHLFRRIRNLDQWDAAGKQNAKENAIEAYGHGRGITEEIEKPNSQRNPSARREGVRSFLTFERGVLGQNLKNNRHKPATVCGTNTN